MSKTDQTIEVTLHLPKHLYERAAQTAHEEQRCLEDLLGSLIAEGLDTRGTVRELFEHVSGEYRARLAGEGKLQQSSEEVLEELRTLREQIARELYS